MIKTDCFAYDPNAVSTKDKCKALTLFYCDKENCPFYKTAQQLAEEQRAANTRNGAENVR